MDEPRPKHMIRKCFECGKDFQALRKYPGYTVYCHECNRKTRWGSPINKANRANK